MNKKRIKLNLKTEIVSITWNLGVHPPRCYLQPRKVPYSNSPQAVLFYKPSQFLYLIQVMNFMKVSIFGDHSVKILKQEVSQKLPVI